MIELVVDNSNLGPRKPPEAVVTPQVAMVGASKASGRWRRVIVVAEDANGDFEVRHSTMTEAQAARMMAVGEQMLRRTLRGEP